MALGNILVLERNANTSAYIIHILKHEGFTIASTTVETVMDDLDSFQPDLLVLELILEGSTTSESLCRHIRGKVVALPIVLISEDDQLPDRAWDYQADAYIFIPFDRVDFINTLLDVLSL